MKERDFRSPDISFRPEIRWWLAEGFHTDQTLKKEFPMFLPRESVYEII